MLGQLVRCHQVYRNFVSLVFGVLCHVENLVQLPVIAGDVDEVYGVAALVENVRFVVRFSVVRHYGELHISGVAAYYTGDVALVAESPRPVFGGREYLFRVLKPDLHVFRAGVGAAVVDGAHGFVGEPA